MSDRQNCIDVRGLQQAEADFKRPSRIRLIKFQAQSLFDIYTSYSCIIIFLLSGVSLGLQLRIIKITTSEKPWLWECPL